MVSINSDELQRVVSSVAGWPAHDRIVLARKILETVEQPLPKKPRGLRAEEVVDLLKMPSPAPSDEECDLLLSAERVRKYDEVSQ